MAEVDPTIKVTKVESNPLDPGVRVTKVGDGANSGEGAEKTVPDESAFEPKEVSGDSNTPPPGGVKDAEVSPPSDTNPPPQG